MRMHVYEWKETFIATYLYEKRRIKETPLECCLLELHVYVVKRDIYRDLYLWKEKYKRDSTRMFFSRATCVCCEKRHVETYIYEKRCIEETPLECFLLELHLYVCENETCALELHMLSRATCIYVCLFLRMSSESFDGEVGGWGRDPFSRNLMSPTPRRKWYLTTGRRFH